MEFLSGFSWAVPTAFSDAIALCRFEQGDTLYDTRKAYEESWTEAKRHIQYWLQVRYPSNGKTASGNSGVSVLENNWGSEIKIDLYKNCQKVEDAQIPTTQGRLYTALWTGNVEVLYLEHQEPKIPLGVQAVTRNLNVVAHKAADFSTGYPVFVMARDLSHKISKNKYSKIYSKLRNHLSDEPQILSPQKAGLPDESTIAPTIEIAFFPMDNLQKEGVEALIKEAVHIPTKNAKKEMFKIGAHGAIF